MQTAIEELVGTYLAAGVEVKGVGKNIVAVLGGLGDKDCVLNLPYEEAVRRLGGRPEQVFRFDHQFSAYDIW